MNSEEYRARSRHNMAKIVAMIVIAGERGDLAALEAAAILLADTMEKAMWKGVQIGREAERNGTH